MIASTSIESVAKNDGVTPVDGDNPVFDWLQFAEIEQAVGPTNARLLLTLLIDEAHSRPDVITRLAAAGSTMALITEAHALRGAAGSVGARRLAAAAAWLEAAVVGGKPMGPAIDEIAAAAIATIDDIKSRI